MLVFVVPMKPRSQARDWRRLSALTRRTLHSLSNQTDRRFRIILIANEMPEGCENTPQMEWVRVDYEPASSANADKMKDKYRRLRRGLIEARSFAPCHFMLTDADDLVSRRLAQLVAEEPDSPGWYLRSGYLHDEDSPWIYRFEPFDQWCGTSHIVRVNPDELPESMEGELEHCFLLTHGHPVIGQYLEERGTPLKTCPFFGAVYLVGSGENYSGLRYENYGGARQKLYRWWTRRKLTPAIRDEYGLHPLAP